KGDVYTWTIGDVAKDSSCKIVSTSSDKSEYWGVAGDIEPEKSYTLTSGADKQITFAKNYENVVITFNASTKVFSFTGTEVIPEDPAHKYSFGGPFFAGSGQWGYNDKFLFDYNEETGTWTKTVTVSNLTSPLSYFDIYTQKEAKGYSYGNYSDNQISGSVESKALVADDQSISFKNNGVYTFTIVEKGSTPWMSVTYEGFTTTWEIKGINPASSTQNVNVYTYNVDRVEKNSSFKIVGTTNGEEVNWGVAGTVEAGQDYTLTSGADKQITFAKNYENVVITFYASTKVFSFTGTEVVNQDGTAKYSLGGTLFGTGFAYDANNLFDWDSETNTWTKTINVTKTGYFNIFTEPEAGVTNQKNTLYFENHNNVISGPRAESLLAFGDSNADSMNITVPGEYTLIITESGNDIFLTVKAKDFSIYFNSKPYNPYATISSVDAHTLASGSTTMTVSIGNNGSSTAISSLGSESAELFSFTLTPGDWKENFTYAGGKDHQTGNSAYVGNNLPKIGSVEYNNGVYQCDITVPVAGTYTLTCNFDGNDDYEAQNFSCQVAVRPTIASLGLTINGAAIPTNGDGSMTVPADDGWGEFLGGSLEHARINTSADIPLMKNLQIWYQYLTPSEESEQNRPTLHRETTNPSTEGYKQYTGAYGIDVSGGKSVRFLPIQNGVAGVPTSYIQMNEGAPTGVEGIEAEEGKARYFNLQGVEVANPAPGIYVKVAGGKAYKVILR
ncbi:MAG: hypothetical protein NC097_01690, partial [Clostridium sp.]|nr:hypothetical protein [Clostridium sp.]